MSAATASIQESLTPPETAKILKMSLPRLSRNYSSFCLMVSGTAPTADISLLSNCGSQGVPGHAL